MAKLATCIVTSIVSTGPAFAIREDNDEDVFIPKAIAELLELEEFDRLRGVLVKNSHENNQNAPWLMRRGRLIDEEGNILDVEGVN